VQQFSNPRNHEKITAVRACDQLWQSNAIVVLADTVRSDLITAHGFVLVFLHRVARPVQIRIDRCLRLGYLFFEGRVPAERNHRPNNHNFSQESHNL